MDNENINDVIDNENESQVTVDEPINNNEVDLINDESDANYFHEHDSLTENNIVDEVKQSFLDYSVSVIKSRALPDLRDGLKPVHRRILWSMYESGYTPDKPHRKSAKTVGEVMGNYHPHGDSSIYEAMVRLAQDFNQRHMLIDGHGNFGNIEGDGAAAMRYTESRLAKVSLELLRDINKDTVDMDDNFDATRKEPKVLPSRFPNILVNGTMGIAVGMATNIPPHNLGEVIDGCIAYIDNPDIDTAGLMEYIKGPDFPTGGIILGNSGIRQAYETGRGTINIRSKASIEEEGNHYNIIVDEVPYGVNTLDLKNKVAELVHNKVIDGIADYHTDLKDGVKITITLKRDANPQVVLNNLYKHTNFQVSYGIILLMLDGVTPKTLGLKDIISKYIDHQKEVIIRRTRFDLKKAEDRVHILEGFKIALDNIDEVINIIRGSQTDAQAQESLISRFGLTEIQAKEILEMRLRRLTGMEKDKIINELNELLTKISDYKDILANDSRVYNIIKDELSEIKSKYADERRTYIDMTAIDYIDDENLIPEENIIVALTNNGYIKRTVVDTFKSQNRGGVGIKGMATNDEDYVKDIINLSTHDYLLFFTNKGKVYRLKGYEVPEFGRTSKGLPIINLLNLEKDEIVNSVIQITREDESKYLMFATKNGLVKKTLLSEFDNIRTNGKICISLKDNDELIAVKKTVGDDSILLGTSAGRMVKFKEEDIRAMGRTASGVKGITLEDDAVCVCCEVANEEDIIVLVTLNGYGKKTLVSEFRETKRGSKGVKALNITEKNGNMVAVKVIKDQNEIVIMTDAGMTMRMPLDQINTLGRITQGVRLIHLRDNQHVSSISLINSDENDGEKSNEEISTDEVINIENQTNDVISYEENVSE